MLPCMASQIARARYSDRRVAAAWPPAERVLMPRKTCAGCRHKTLNPAAAVGPDGALNMDAAMCVKDPPRAYPIVGADGSLLGAFSVYPPVNDKSIACSAYES
jgi:hypothetical protein